MVVAPSDSQADDDELVRFHLALLGDLEAAATADSDADARLFLANEKRLNELYVRQLVLQPKATTTSQRSAAAAALLVQRLVAFRHYFHARHGTSSTTTTEQAYFMICDAIRSIETRLLLATVRGMASDSEPTGKLRRLVSLFKSSVCRRFRLCAQLSWCIWQLVNRTGCGRWRAAKERERTNAACSSSTRACSCAVSNKRQQQQQLASQAASRISLVLHNCSAHRRPSSRRSCSSPSSRSSASYRYVVVIRHAINS